MFDITTQMIVEDDVKAVNDYLLKQGFFHTWIVKVYPFIISEKQVGTIDDKGFSKRYYIFENEWRNPLTISEILIFKILMALKKKLHFHCLEHYTYVTRCKNNKLFMQIIAVLEKEGYIKVDRKYVYKNMRIQVTSSKVEIKCLNPQGKIVSNNKYFKKYLKFKGIV